MADTNNKKPRSWKRTLVIVLCSVLAVLLAATAAVVIWLDASFFSRLGRPDEEYTLSSEEIESIMGPDTSDITLPTIPAEIIKPSENVINVLLVGQDRREGQPRLHSDAMILCTINKTQKTLTMTSFMRDMWVKIPGYGNQRINVPYLLDGFDLLNETLEYNFGVRADYNVEVDFTGFMTAVDRVGGIDIELTAAEAKFLNENGNWDVEENQNWTLIEGINHLTGSQALAYSRIRKIGDDFARTERQRTVMSALIHEAKKLSMSELYDLVYDLIPLITTDMTNGEIMGCVIDLAPMLSDMEIVSQRIPMDGQYSFDKIDGNEVIVLSESNYKKCRALLAETMKDK